MQEENGTVNLLICLMISHSNTTRQQAENDGISLCNLK